MPKKALIILHSGFEEMEAVAPIDLLARAEVEVVQAALGTTPLVTGRNGMTLQATHALADVIDDEFDAVILPGGPGIYKLRKHPAICKRLQRQITEGKLVACICAAPLLLLDADLIQGKRYTAHPSTASELVDASPQCLVNDTNLLTSQGAGTATEFALAIVQHLCGEACARSIANSICWSHPLPTSNTP